MPMGLPPPGSVRASALLSFRHWLLYSALKLPPLGSVWLAIQVPSTGVFGVTILHLLDQSLLVPTWGFMFGVGILGVDPHGLCRCAWGLCSAMGCTFSLASVSGFELSLFCGKFALYFWWNLGRTKGPQK